MWKVILDTWTIGFATLQSRQMISKLMEVTKMHDDLKVKHLGKQQPSCICMCLNNVCVYIVANICVYALISVCVLIYV